jgi:hypothetical protein
MYVYTDVVILLMSVTGSLKRGVVVSQISL